MMGRLNHEQGQLFYSFWLEEAVADDHPVRGITAVLDLSWVHCVIAGGRAVEVARLKITEAGRQALARRMIETALRIKN